MFYLTTHSTHFIYGYMASDIWLRTILIVSKETRCRHIGYSFRLTAKVLLYAPSHREDSTYHGLCYTSRGALVGTRNSSMGPPWRIDPTTHRIMSERSYHGAISHSLEWEITQWVHHEGSIRRPIAPWANTLAPCPDDVMNLGNGLLCSDFDWPSPTGVVFQTITAKFEFSILLLHHAVSRGILP